MALVFSMTIVPKIVQALSKSTYEYFLIHGMCFAAVGRYLRGSWWLISFGLVLAFATSCYGAIVLRNLAGKLEKVLARAISMIKQTLPHPS